MSEAESTIEAGADEAAGDNTQFTPKVKVEKIEVKTLEEDEEVCLKLRSKLYVFVAEDVYGGEVRQNFWKERGTGDVKLLKHKELGKVRLLMRQEKTLKICANHLVSPFVQLKPNVGSDRSWVFTASDFADEELKTETFAIKFGSPENANIFKDKIEIAKEVNAGNKDPSSLPPISDDDEKADIDKKIEERNKREQVRRDSVRLQSAVEDSDHDSQAEDVNEEGTERIKATVGNPSPEGEALAEGVSNVRICGGYSGTDLEDDSVKEAAQFAVGALNKGELVRLVKAEKQVVAGMNFRLTLEIKSAEGAVHSFTCTVFKPLPCANKEMSLSGFTDNGAV
mmetsp:Transcript_9291/g.15109  ORF Transcript_9291/g.15109 Transcript_9291/m.15109 type:complete len:339 (-) Transcript_9291:2675-3691(-)|eukprot:CAMPEP_0203745490 /NCGR_PEP_ID=MMETSP0098-20131031/1214_1 /ASSEMBLY_ACC=CAM_ASM_000208 /TAXON_ID=96639 /ORGANISM=" , Strain NY0313808BC1" /LENGTH=338 /DNA_ID=CAMNT_0050633287 /DNA_START=68 /DNA_END=1084 /DNA_ORIENTATION=-